MVEASHLSSVFRTKLRHTAVAFDSTLISLCEWPNFWFTLFDKSRGAVMISLRLHVFLSALLAVIGAGSVLAQTTNPKIIKIIGPECQADGVREHSVLIAENRNGTDGVDFFIKYKCNGDVNVGEWNGATAGSIEEACNTTLGVLPVQFERVTLDLKVHGTTELGGPAWTIEERLPDGSVVAITERHPNGRLTYVVLQKVPEPDISSETVPGEPTTGEGASPAQIE
jgi:hypothetical protein